MVEGATACRWCSVHVPRGRDARHYRRLQAWDNCLDKSSFLTPRCPVRVAKIKALREEAEKHARGEWRRGSDARPFRRNPDVCIISVQRIMTPSGASRYALGITQLRIERHDGIRSTSISVISSFVRSYNLVVRGDSCPAICWACSSRPSFSR